MQPPHNANKNVELVSTYVSKSLGVLRPVNHTRLYSGRKILCFHIVIAKNVNALKLVYYVS